MCTLFSGSFMRTGEWKTLWFQICCILQTFWTVSCIVCTIICFEAKYSLVDVWLSSWKNVRYHTKYHLDLSFLFVFLSLFSLSPQNLLTLVSYYSNFCTHPPFPQKICLFSFQQPGGSSLARRVPSVYIPPSAAVPYANSVLSIPADCLLQVSHSLLWMYSPWKPFVTISALFSPLSPILSLLLWTYFSPGFVTLLFTVGLETILVSPVMLSSSFWFCEGVLPCRH